MSNSNLFRILIRWAILMVMVAAGLLLAAGTAHLPKLNAYIVALAPSLLIMMLAIAPQIAKERGSADGGKHDLHDARARLALVVLFLITIFMAALDVGRLHLSNHVPLAVSVIALPMYIAGSGFRVWAMSVNSFSRLPYGGQGEKTLFSNRIYPAIKTTWREYQGVFFPARHSSCSSHASKGFLSQLLNN